MNSRREITNALAVELGGLDGLSKLDRTTVRNLVALKLRLEHLRGDATVSARELALWSGAVRRIQENLTARLKRAHA
jgi:hypothetical protein